MYEKFSDRVTRLSLRITIAQYALIVIVDGTNELTAQSNRLQIISVDSV